MSPEGAWMLVAGIDLPRQLARRPGATFAEGRISGSTGCNRYTGAYTTVGHTLELGPLATTRMACPPPADAVERAFLDALTRVDGWRLERGELVLVVAGGEPLRFAPSNE